MSNSVWLKFIINAFTSLSSFYLKFIYLLIFFHNDNELLHLGFHVSRNDNIFNAVPAV